MSETNTVRKVSARDIFIRVVVKEMEKTIKKNGTAGR